MLELKNEKKYFGLDIFKNMVTFWSISPDNCLKNQTLFLKSAHIKIQCHNIIFWKKKSRRTFLNFSLNFLDFLVWKYLQVTTIRRLCVCFHNVVEKKPLKYGKYYRASISRSVLECALHVVHHFLPDVLSDRENYCLAAY